MATCQVPSAVINFTIPKQSQASLILLQLHLEATCLYKFPQTLA